MNICGGGGPGLLLFLTSPIYTIYMLCNLSWKGEFVLTDFRHINIQPVS